jgi:hypothetical protein
VRAIAGFVIRLVAYALVLGVSARIAQSLWINDNLDTVNDLQAFHDIGISVMVIAPLVCALLGVGVLRRVMIFVAAFLVGVALTAPFACARFAGG